MTKRLFIIILIIFSVGLNILLAGYSFWAGIELAKSSKSAHAQEANEKAVRFAKLFVNKFLMGQGTVGFEDRLALENAVRDIQDPEIFKAWQSFTTSPDDRQAQVAAGRLLNLLFGKPE